MTRHMSAQHEAHTDQMVALARQCIVALDAGDHFPGVPLVGGDGPTPIYGETCWALNYNPSRFDVDRRIRTAYLAEPPPAKAQPEMEQRGLHSLVPSPGFGLDDDAHPLAAWLPVICWLGFAGCVWLLVWAWFS